MLDSRGAILFAMFIATATNLAHAADLRWERYIDPDWRPPVRRVYPPEPAQPVYRYKTPERPTIKKGDRLPMSSSSEEGDEGQVTVKPRDARPLVSAAASASAPAEPASKVTAEDRGYLIPLLVVILAMIGVFSVFGSLPRLARTIDRLFEPATGEATADEPAVVHLGESASEASPVNHHDEIAAMRAMKEELEAQAAAARAAIEEALARANHDQKGDAA